MPAKVFQRETIETGHAGADARSGWSELDRSARNSEAGAASARPGEKRNHHRRAVGDVPLSNEGRRDEVLPMCVVPDRRGFQLGVRRMRRLVRRRSPQKSL
jgi:hypothetical protein